MKSIIESPINWNEVVDQQFFKYPDLFIMPKVKLILEIFRDENHFYYKEQRYHGKFNPYKNSDYQINFDIHSDFLCEFDLIVFWGICSIFEVGNTSFTIPQLGRTLGYNRPSNKILENIKESIERMITSEIKYIDYKSHFLEYGNKITEYEDIINEPILPLHKTLINLNNGRIQTGYKLVNKITLLEYAKEVRQIGYFPADYIKKIKNINHTSEVISLFFYLMWYLDFLTFKGKDNELIIHCDINTLIKRSGISFEGISRNTKNVKRKRWFSNLKKLLNDLIGSTFHNYRFTEYNLEKKGNTIEKLNLIFEKIKT